jgi:hypothetical protein
VTDAILKRIVEAYRPYNTYVAFKEGYRTYQLSGSVSGNPYDGDSVDAQAWDRGANAAMLYGRALAHLADHPEQVDSSTSAQKAGPGWLATLLRRGRC